MRYFGGKSRIGKDITSYLKSVREESQVYIEPFVGSGSVMTLMDGERYAYDKHPYLISMYQELQKGWIPPTTVLEDEYKNAKDGNLSEHLTGFIGFGCSFAGKWFGGYARSNRNENFSLQSHNSMMKKMKTMQDVKFECRDYLELNPVGALIYCDPPYKGTTQYGKIVGDFDSELFWDKMREWSKSNTVVISEYNAPDDFEEVWRRETKTEIRNKSGEREDRIEKLFMLRK